MWALDLLRAGWIIALTYAMNELEQLKWANSAWENGCNILSQAADFWDR